MVPKVKAWVEQIIQFHGIFFMQDDGGSENSYCCILRTASRKQHEAIEDEVLDGVECDLLERTSIVQNLPKSGIFHRHLLET